MVHEIENFFGVYLLYNVNPQFKGRIYIGYTVDPNRRVKQHNLGSHAGGAHRTSGRGPWEMVLIIHGFPNSISALRFEWAWQNPKKSRRLRHLPAKRTKEKQFDYRFRVLCNMLRTGPWERLGLTIRWLKQEYRQEFPPDLLPPKHMPIAFGLVKAKKAAGAPGSREPASGDHDDDDGIVPLSQVGVPRCCVCRQRLQGDANTVSCVLPACPAISHTACLAKHFLLGESDALVPVTGACPVCTTQVLWGDVMRHKAGCYHELSEDVSDTEDHWTDQLQQPV